MRIGLPALATLVLAVCIHAEECDPNPGGQTPPQADPGQGAQDRGAVGGPGTGRLADEVTGGAFFAPDGGPDSATAACLAALDDLERGTDGGGAGGDPPTGPSGDGGIGPSVESLISQAMTYSELAGGLEVEARVEELALRRNGDSLSEQEREKAQGSIDKLRGHARDMKQKAQDCARQIESSAKGSK